MVREHMGFTCGAMARLAMAVTLVHSFTACWDEDALGPPRSGSGKVFPRERNMYQSTNCLGG